MSDQQAHIENLFVLWINNRASAAQEQELMRLLGEMKNDTQLDEIMGKGWQGLDNLVRLTDEQRDLITQKSIGKSNSAGSPVPAHRVHFLKRWGWAAASVILLASGAYLYLTDNNPEKTIVTGNRQLQAEIAPGGDRAILTLADGRKIALDNASNGQLAQQGNAQVVKLANGEIAYHLHGLSEKEVMWNTMSTPVGGQYQVTLPDGTKVWLNAASSITFPTAFINKDRQVKITGEVYFEVARNKAKPFKVDVDGKSLIEVLGTSFNINSYSDEGKIKATLVEGSVRVGNGKNQVILKPGQQAVTTIAMSSRSEFGTSADRLPANAIEIVKADMEQTIAWKNGLFNFNGLSVHEVLNQLARWYDIKVEVHGREPDFRFMGEMYRNVNLSDVLEMLKKVGVKFRMDGKTLIVTE